MTTELRESGGEIEKSRDGRKRVNRGWGWRVKIKSTTKICKGSMGFFDGFEKTGDIIQSDRAK
jgi:hypothetical protein